MSLAFKVAATGFIALALLIVVMRYEDETGSFSERTRFWLGLASIAAIAAIIGGTLAGIWQA